MPPKKSNRGRGGSSKNFDVSSLNHQFTEFNDLVLPSNGDIIRYSRLSHDSTYKKVLRLLEEAKELDKGGIGKSNQVLLEKLSRMSDCLFDLFKCR